MKIAVVDDDPNELNTLKEYFKHLHMEIRDEMDVHCYASGKEFICTYDYSFDLICLDINMPEMNGISTAQYIRSRDEEVIIIFVTNMAQMAIKGYEVRALDFLVKPVNYYSFAMKMRSVINIINNKKSKSFIITTSNGIQKISTNELYFAEINGHYLYYHTSGGTFKQKSTLKELEGKLKGLSFKRCNNCYLVNLKYVESINKDDVKVGGEWLKISRPKKKEFLQSLGNYMGGAKL